MLTRPRVGVEVKELGMSERPSYRRRVVHNDGENMFLTGIVVSDEVCEKTLPSYNPSYLQNDFGKRIAGWVSDYYQQYKRAPYGHIEQIFEVNKTYLDEATSNLISDFLGKLSSEYASETGEYFLEGKFNADYVVDRTLTFFQSREAHIRANNVLLLLDKGDTKGAIKEFDDFRSIEKPSSKSSSPFDDESLKEVYIEDTSNRLFKLNGGLGRLFGWFERGWLVSFIAPMKRGKSWFLLFLSLMASRKRLRVLFVSLEMKKANVNNRIHRMMSQIPRYDTSVIIPMFDCRKNQDGSCKDQRRPKQPEMFDDKGDRKKSVGEAWQIFKSSLKLSTPIEFKSCDACRQEKYSNYVFSLWWEKQSRKGMDVGEALKMARREKMQFGDNLRVLCGPKFTLTLDDIEEEVDRLERDDGFLVDVVVIDHADNLKVVRRYSEQRENVDENWKDMARLGSVRNILVVTATQGNRQSISSESVEQEHTSEDIRKLAHVDAMFTINQTKQERAQGVVRIGVMVHRHMEYNELDQCRVLQAFSIGGVCLASDYITLSD